MRRTHLFLALAVMLAAVTAGVGCEREHVVLGPGVTTTFVPPPPPPPTNPVVDSATAQRELGRLLFFDKILSGDRSTACSSCHVVFLQATETVLQSIGHGGVGVGPTRTAPNGAVSLGRNTPDIFLRTSPNFTTLFWDGRLEFLSSGIARTPVALPVDLFELTSLQALMPLADANEMLGTPDDPTNDAAIAAASGGNFAAWDVYVARLQATPGYPELFATAFPSATGGIQIELVAHAITAFERALWERFDTPFDTGDSAASLGLDPTLVAQGNTLFFGDAQCVECHSGAFLTDLSFHNIGVPQFGVGKDPVTHLDQGRGRITQLPEDLFAFRTPPLRNVALTAPYMHDGAYATLEEAVRHHLDREGSLRSYDPSGLPPDLASMMHDSPEELDLIASTITTFGLPSRPLTDQEILALVEFLKALTSPLEDQLTPEAGVPLAVPSGLPVDVWPGGPHPSRLMNLGH